MKLRDHTYLGATQSLCPECLAVVPAKIIAREGRVYFRKHCPTHGTREDFVCSDVSQYDQMQYSVPGKIPEEFGTEAKKGCPLDCGLCTEHEQHTCVGLVELTTSCNLKCPMCYASSGPGGKHLTVAEAKGSIDRLVEVEGRPEVLQLSGGEPTIHPDFAEILAYACAQPIDIVMINTNGLRLAQDPDFAASLAPFRHRLEVYLQFDGFDDDTSRALRGAALADVKERALAALGEHRINTTLVATLQPGVNDDQIGRLVTHGLERPWVTGVSFQPATYSGRHVTPETLESRLTFPDVIRLLVEQTDGLFRQDDFMPLPCAHPNCHSLSYLYRANGKATPLLRFIDGRKHLEILANGITFTRNRARRLIESYLSKIGCFAGPGCTMDAGTARMLEAAPEDRATAAEFFQLAMAEKLSPQDVFRITITSFLDAYNFDVRRLMKCCIHHVLPSGHLIPFCAYNVLYRDGHVQLPELKRIKTAAAENL